MEVYDRVASRAAKQLTRSYSTSFSLAARLFDASIRDDIYNIYGLVRVADEIVDTYRGVDSSELLNDLERETLQAIDRGYSSNIIVHAFALTARKYGINAALIEPFFASMRMDLVPRPYDRQKYQEYIYGSAEVVGLMCLRVFVAGDTTSYDHLAPGAKALGAAFQKVNFLRDLADDTAMGRNYFPELQAGQFNEDAKQRIITDIDSDFQQAERYIIQLPPNAKRAVTASCRYYQELLIKLKKTPAETIAQRRMRLPNTRKLLILAGQAVRR